MPVFVVTQRFPVERERLFGFFLRPANLVAVAPPGLNLTLIDGPEVLRAGARWTVTTRRFGLSARIVSEVVELAEPERFVEEQREGPFRRWRLERVFSAVGEAEAEVCERIDYEPPGGLLGLTFTMKAIEAELAEAYRWRQERLAVILDRMADAAGAS
jgi:ligand-binding SRPBCC domain-containing protein